MFLGNRGAKRPLEQRSLMENKGKAAISIIFYSIATFPDNIYTI